MALAFVWPWLPRAAPGGSALERYVPRHGGQSVLLARYSTDGGLAGWSSENTAHLPTSRAVGAELRRSALTSIGQLYRQPDEPEVPENALVERLGNARLYEIVTRDLSSEGALDTRTTVFVREARGDFLVGFYHPSQDVDVVFGPPILVLPADLALGRTWQSQGSIGAFSYRFEGEVVAESPFEGSNGSFPDCLNVVTRFVINQVHQDAQTVSVVSDTSSNEWLCAGIGLVAARDMDASGQVTGQRIVVTTDRGPLKAERAETALPAPGPWRDQPPLAGDSSAWTLTRLGRARQQGDTAEGTIPPVWLPTEPPTLLSAAYGGNLVAFDVHDAWGAVQWHFHPGGTIFSPPTFDAESGRIFFGASDKRMYALDARGLFLWAFETSDNIATQAVVVGDTVVFGAEDRTIYGVDRWTGALRWTRETGAANVSSPARLGDLVLIGSDDGAVYAIDPESGALRWLYELGDPIEAPIVVADEVAYAVDRAGNLAAFDASACSRQCEPLWIRSTGLTVRAAPAVDARFVYLVDDAGDLATFNRQNGQRLWTTAAGDYVGAPVPAIGGVVATTADGFAHLLDAADGRVRQRWATAEASLPGDGAPQFTLGPVEGGGALWLVDANAVVRRLGDASTLAGPVPLPVAWSRLITEAPLKAFGLTATPATYRGQALVLDNANNAFLLDPTTGSGSELPSLGITDGRVPTGPVVVDETLLAIAGRSLRAWHLPDLRPLWAVPGGTAMFAPVVDGDQALWLTLQGSEDASEAAGIRLQAVDLASGAIRWQRDLPPAPYVGGVAVHAGQVYLSSPPMSVDARTGEVLWHTAVESLGVARPAVAPEAGIVALSVLDPASDLVSILGLDAADGRERWRYALEGDLVSPTESLWEHQGIVIVPAVSGRIVGLDAASGEERWRFNPSPGSGPRFGTVTVADGRIWTALESGQVVLLDALTGSVEARYTALEPDLSRFNLAQRPLVLGDHALMPLGGKLLSFPAPPR